MNLVTQVSAVVMLVVGGIWAGVIFTYAIERVNLWQRMPIDQYVIDFRRSLYRADPLQPILGVIAALAAAVFALSTAGPASISAWIGVGLVVIVIVVSIAFPERINSQFRRRVEGDAPPDAEMLRIRWRRLHLIRTVPALASLVALAASVAL